MVRNEDEKELARKFEKVSFYEYRIMLWHYVVLLGVTYVLGDVCHIIRVKVKGAVVWSGYRRAASLWVAF
jgi:hypothetical protein